MSFIILAHYLHQHGELWFDAPILNFLAKHRTLLLDNFFLWSTWAGSSFVLLPISTGIAVVLIRYRYYPAALLMGIGFSGASLMTKMIKTLMVRERPILFPPLEIYGGFSFPSGHTTQVAAFALSVFLIISRIRPRWQWPASILLTVLVLCVSTSRLYLQVHYPSDILGGCLVALIWVFSIDALIRTTIRIGTLKKPGGQ
ncbi:phosphatase PAP2 family protein [Nitrosococcus watsonii]|uniref:phosphatase PAP2 family protein n=1 Tax=Nitrosococcus watsonii TaxID=473531 RepID=UPI001E3226BD|nr:phosphatase PAP2 family protein [Nitrosococcus watsonii]